MLRKNIEGSVGSYCRFFQDSFEPGESSARMLQATVRLARSKRLLVRLKKLSAELDAQLIHCTLTNRVKSEASLVELLLLTAFADSAEVFQDLKSQLFAQSVPLLLYLCNLLCVLHVVLEVK